MQTDIFQGLEVFTGFILPFILGMAAATARTARYGWKGFAHFVADATVCVFVSVIVFWGLDVMPEIAPTVKAAITGLSAFMCNELLDWMRRRARFEILNRWRHQALRWDAPIDKEMNENRAAQPKWQRPETEGQNSPWADTRPHR